MTTPAHLPSETDPVAASPAVDPAVPAASAPAGASPTGKPLPAWQEKLKALIAENGATAIYVYFGIFGIVLVGFALAIQFGADVQGVAGTAGTWGAAYVATKLTQPLRIAATLVITPMLTSLLRRFRRKRASQPPVPPRELP